MGKLEKGRCGLCCSLVVRLNKRDIDKIKALGYKEGFFVEKNSLGEDVLKRINGYCVFVEIKQGIASCVIYETRPRKCREYICVYNGEDDCRLKRHYTVVDTKKL